MLNFFKSMSWLIVSNAFWRSTKIIPVPNPSSKPFKFFVIQGHIRYGNSARMKCTSNAYLTIKLLIFGSHLILISFLNREVKTFKGAGIDLAPAVDELLLLSITIESVDISAKMCHESHLFARTIYFQILFSKKGTGHFYMC